MGELTRQKLAREIPKFAAGIALIAATTLCEPLDWMVTIYGWTQDGFNAWDILAFAPGVSSAMVRKATGTIADMASYSSKMLRQYNKYDGGVEAAYKQINRGVNTAEGAAKTEIASSAAQYQRLKQSLAKEEIQSVI